MTGPFKTLQKQVYANAMVVYSAWGGGTHGHLIMLMPQAEYLAMAGVGNAYIAPPHPGPHPIHAPNATNAQITAANQKHSTALEEFKTHQALHEAICAQILATVDTTFTQTLAHDVIGYRGCQLGQYSTISIGDMPS